MNVSKILKLVWLISFLGVFAVLFYVYAGLKEMVAYSGEQETSMDYVSKETFFYFFMILIGFTNTLFYFLAKNGVGLKHVRSQKMHRIISWEYGLAIVVNLFLTISMLFISVFNSGEKFDYSNFGYLVYFSFGLVLIWIISLPFVIYSSRVKV